MHLATTALTDFWDESQEQLFLGTWCFPREKISKWQDVRGKVMPSPWDEPGRCNSMVTRCEKLQDSVLGFLGNTLNEALDVHHTERYWRILLGPWVMAYTNAIADGWLSLDTAMRLYPDLQTLLLDPQDYVVPRDTGDYCYRVLTDSFHLQIYSELFLGAGRHFPTRRFTGQPEPDLGGNLKSQKGWKAVVQGLLQVAARIPRLLGLPEAYFGDLNIDRSDCWALIKASRGDFWPVGEILPRTFAPAADRGTRRQRLMKYPVHDDLDRLIALTLPNHFPTLFLEGYHSWRIHVLSRWPRPPRRILTSVGWLANEYLKMLAAESVERGGRFAICQHGGGYGIMNILHSERHERRVADQYWTWGWDEAHEGGASLHPMPHPKASRRIRARGSEDADEAALICSSFPRYPYLYYFANIPAGHRQAEYLMERERFVAALPSSVRDRLKVHLYSVDLGWGHQERLAARYPALRFTSQPWLQRVDHLKLLIIDHPQTSILEALSRDLPTILFWNPVLWPNRPAANPTLDGLRRGGILYDDPESAAAQVAKTLNDPLTWWRGSIVQEARLQFCRRHARGDREWAKRWAQAAKQL